MSVGVLAVLVVVLLVVAIRFFERMDFVVFPPSLKNVFFQLLLHGEKSMHQLPPVVTLFQ